MVIPEYPPWNRDLEPEKYPCKHCSAVFEKYDEWFEHRFHMHPVLRPILVLGDIEVVAPRFVVMKILPSDSVRFVNVQSGRVNGSEIELPSLAALLASSDNGFFDIRLTGGDGQVESRYEVSIEIPTEEHLLWIERDFGKLAATSNLSIHGVNAFIQSTASAASARRYADGLGNYLFGVLGKDQRGGTALTQEQGRAKLNEAHQTLQQVDRPLAKVVGAVIEFQSNAFFKTGGLQTVPRLRHAMKWFKAASDNDAKLPVGGHDIDTAAISRVPLDGATDELLTWVNATKEGVTTQLNHIEKRARDPAWLPDDRAKARVLIAAIHLARGNHADAVQTARSFRHDPVFQHLAEQVIADGLSRR